MSLLLLLKTHSRRQGRGQRLIIVDRQDVELPNPGFVNIDDKLINVADVPAARNPTAAELIAEIPYFKRKPKVAKQFEKTFQQGLNEGVSIEDMVLLYMMTER